MGFLDNVILPNNTKVTSSSAPKAGGFLNSVVMPPKGYVAPAPAEVIPQQSVTQKVIGAVKDYATASANTVNNLGNAILHPIDTYNKIQSTFLDPYIEGVTKAGAALNSSFSDRGSAQIADLANVVTGVASAAFAPLTGLFKIAENTPGLKQVADVMNVPFTASGVAGGYASGKFIDILPISQDSKDILKQPIKDLGSLAAQVFVGGAIMKYVEGYNKQGQPITPEIAKTIVEDTKTQTSDHPIVQNDTQISSLKANTMPAQVSNSNFVNSVIKPETSTPTKETPIVDNSTVEPVDSNKVSGVAKSIEAKAIEAKLTTEFPDKATYESSTFKEQAQKTADLINSGIDNARAVVRGDIAMPEGLKAAPLIAGMEEYAKNNSTEAPEIMSELANSHLATTISTGASETSFARMREPDSATKVLQDLKKAKIQAAGGDQAVEKIRKVVKDTNADGKVLLPKESLKWDNFLDSIKC